MTLLIHNGKVIHDDPKLVLFDKDGTLIDIHHYWVSMICLRARRMREVFFSNNADGNQIEKEIEQAMGVDHAACRVRPEGPVGVMPRPFIVDVARRTLLKHNIFANREEIEGVFLEIDAQTKADLLPLLKLLPGVRDILDALKKNNVTLGIVSTDITDRIIDAVNALGLSNYFKVILGGDAVAKTKPSPELVFAALSETGHSAKQTVVIGDHPVDIQMGSAAGASLNIAVLTGLADRDSFDPDVAVIINNLTCLKVQPEVSHV